MTIQMLTGREAETESRALPRRARTMTAEARQRVAEAWQLFEAACDGSYSAKAKLEEALSTSDFPKLMAAALDVKLLAEYAAITPVWSQFATMDTVPDFRVQSWIDLLGGKGELDKIGEGAPYPRRSVTENDGSYSVGKYGASIGLTWEMFKNDRLNAFRRLPRSLAVAARELEDRIATKALTDGDGPNATLFGATAAKGLAGASVTTLLASNPVLTEANVEAALVTIGTRVDYDGRPVQPNGQVLVVPPALQITAERIVGATEVRETVGSRLIVRTNPLAGRLRVVVDPWLTVIDKSTNAATSWQILPDPTSNERPAVVLAKLAGHEEPDLRVKNDQGQRVDGGSISPEEGSFDDDTIAYRVRHVAGAGVVDPIAAAYSNGSAT